MVAAAITTGLIGSLQLVYWKYYSGHWFVYSYEDQGFSFLRPHLINGLFSFKKGWLVYTPIMVFAILGLLPLYVRHRKVFWAVLVFSGINVYITFSWDIWWYGGSFGQRAMVQSYAVWLIPFAAFLQWAFQHKGRWLPFIPLAGICIWLNLLQTYHAHIPDGLMYSEGLTGKYWVEAFVKQKRGKALRQYIDLPFEAPNEDKLKEKNLLITVVPQDTVAGFHQPLTISGVGPDSFLVAKTAMPAHTDKDWVRATAKVYYQQMEWNEWKMARLGIRFYSEGQEVYYNSTRLQWLFEPNTWHKVEVEIPLTQSPARPDSIAVYLENPGKELYADTITLELLRVK